MELEGEGTNEIACRGDIRPTSDINFDLGTSNLRWDDIVATNGTVNTSDIRNKRDIKEISYGLAEVLKLRPVSYRWKDKEEGGEKIKLVTKQFDRISYLKSHIGTLRY